MIDKLSLHVFFSLLMPMAAAIGFSGCGLDLQPEPTATPDIPATVNAAVTAALGTPVARPVEVRPGYCGRLCDDSFWQSATLADVKSEFDKGVDVHAAGPDGYTPLHGAAFAGKVSAVELFLDRGANIDSKEIYGNTSLHYAVTPPGKQTVVELLLNRGADVNTGNGTGNTPLHIASVGSPSIVKLLLDHGADVNAKLVGSGTGAGSTPLHAAALAGNTAAIQLLLDGGADINASDNEGTTVCGNLRIGEMVRSQSSPASSIVCR